MSRPAEHLPQADAEPQPKGRRRANSAAGEVLLTLQPDEPVPQDDPPPEAPTATLPSAPVELASVEEELAQLNLSLQRAGLKFRVEDLDDLQQAKKAAGIGNTLRPVADFVALVARLKDALRLGAFDDVDGDAGRKQEFANELKQALIKEVPARRKRLNAMSLSFEDCLKMCGQVTEEAMFGLTPGALARKIADRIGHGNLAGLFPGESEEATSEPKSEPGGKDRLDKMVDLGADVVNFLKQVGDVSPEVTGSIVLIGGGYEGIPEDLDINVTTKGTPEERKEMWEAVVETMNQYDGMSVPIKGGSIRVFPMTPGKIQGENAAIWERRYGYVIKVGKQQGKVMPFEVEVKDVGGDVWKEHLLPTADTRDTDSSGASRPQWLLVDTMTRILGHRKAMKDSAKVPNNDYLEGVPVGKRAQRWVEIVAREGLDKSVGKRLWEKLHVSADMARQHLRTGHTTVEKWLSRQVKDAPAYLELLELADDEKKYEEWLADIAPPHEAPAKAEVIDEVAAQAAFSQQAPTTAQGWVDAAPDNVAALLRCDRDKAVAIQQGLAQCQALPPFARLEDVDVPVAGSFDVWSQRLTEAVTRSLEDAVKALNVRIAAGLPAYAQQALTAICKPFADDLAARKAVLADVGALRQRYIDLGGQVEPSEAELQLKAIAAVKKFLVSVATNAAWKDAVPALQKTCDTVEGTVTGGDPDQIKAAAQTLADQIAGLPLGTIARMTYNREAGNKFMEAFGL